MSPKGLRSSEAYAESPACFFLYLQIEVNIMATMTMERTATAIEPKIKFP
jgi:hypothetical protein